jgi:DNA (cytosine-5)-methyltransferase 1
MASFKKTAKPVVNATTPDVRDEHLAITETDIELFAGGGGMAIGLKKAGFSPACMVEWDKKACETLRLNLRSDCPTLSGQVMEWNANLFDWSTIKQDVRLLAAGAPCQPFSLAGKHLAENDARNLFPQVLRAVRALRPQAIFLENVRGLKRHSFQPYFDYILRQLECPSMHQNLGESWKDHDERIVKCRGSRCYHAEYQIVSRVVDAADYGVPQNRQRVIVVAVRSDFPAYDFPKATHSRAALMRTMHSGEYWDRHAMRKPKSLAFPNPSDDEVNGALPWLTVRDALTDLPEPARLEDEAHMNHWVIPGAKSYAGHTGSILEWPGKTIKAGVHGVPGGENTVVDDRGKFRYFSLRETARIQTFPDNHLFFGARIHITRQIGNAVPCALAELLAKPLSKILKRRNPT